MTDTLAWLQEHYRLTQIPEIGDAVNELSALRNVCDAAKLVRLVSLGDDADRQQIEAFGRLQIALDAVPRRLKP